MAMGSIDPDYAQIDYEVIWRLNFDPRGTADRTERLPTDRGINTPQELGALQVMQSTSGWQQLVDCATLQLRALRMIWNQGLLRQFLDTAFDLTYAHGYKQRSDIWLTAGRYDMARTADHTSG